MKPGHRYESIKLSQGSELLNQPMVLCMLVFITLGTMGPLFSLNKYYLSIF